MIKAHRCPGRGPGCGAVVDRVLRHPPGLVEQLVALEDADAVPGGAEGDLYPFGVVVIGRPRVECRSEILGQDGRLTLAVVLPGQQLVDADPPGVGEGRALTDEREVSDADRTSGRFAAPVAVAERVELLGITEFETGLLTHASPQPQLQRLIGGEVEKSRRQRRGVLVADYEQPRLVVGDRDDDSFEADRHLRIGRHVARS